MAYLSPFLAALRKRVTDAWPEVEANGVWLVVQIERFAFQEFAEQGRLPVAILQVMLSPDAEHGIVNKMDAGSVTVYYVAEEAGPETAEVLLAKADVLREQLYSTTGLDVGQVVDWPEARCDEELPPNQYFFNRNMPFLAAAVTFQVIVGEQRS